VQWKNEVRMALGGLLMFLVGTALMMTLLTLVFLGVTILAGGLFIWMLLESGVV